MLERFDFESYRRLLGWMSREQPCVGFREALALGDDPYCIVRHDVDFSLPAALRVAALEAELGVKATYFLLFSAQQYNLLAPGNAQVPRALVELGHDVGLHYDTSAVADLAPAAALAVLHTEAALLETLSGAAVDVVARHNPGFGGDDPLAAEGRWLSAYDARFTTDIVYVSDSCGAWRSESLDVLGAPQPPHRLQLLTHPMLWDEQALDRWTHLERLQRAQAARLDSDIAFVREAWSGHPAVVEHDGRARRAGPPSPG